MSCLCSSQNIICTSTAVDEVFDSKGARSCGRFSAVRVLDSKHPYFNQAVEVIGRAFCGTEKAKPDPCSEWVYSGTTENLFSTLPIAPSEKRLAWFRWLARVSSHWGLKRQGVYVLADGHDMSGISSNGTVVAAAIMAPPGSPSTMDINICDELALLWAAGFPPKDDSTAKGSSVLDRLKAMETALADMHKKVMDQYDSTANAVCSTKSKSKRSTDLHIAMLACDPDRQGQGCGSMMLQLIAQIADADGVPCYLETTGERHEAFYSKGGFKTVERVVIEHKNLRMDVNGGVAGMVRPAQKAAKEEILS
eukprot:gnl/MRDRNA2_/MRDRNA2_63079_c0_seq1.p1 gnl/MRDRNA2_/MRDRNA2_63079_c0~~gnl/MRDRNA2_/MRDRNA2_63079_c0_seq1.p1  ORF type:complete len:308 (-),score=56.46 gnl/MRDRNA2_/MRDRNA2_63079_c0_seq1:337-1260(-)